MNLKKLFGGLLLSASLWSAAHAQVVGIFSDPGYSPSASGLAAYLNTQGFTATASVSFPADFSAFDAVISIRTSNPGAALSSWVSGGGLLITEWDSTDWAAPLIGANITTGGYIGTSTSVTFTSAGIAAGLNTGLTNPYSDSGATEFFRTFGSIGTGTVWATRGSNIPVIVQGSVGSGDVILMAHDWADTAFDGGAYLANDPTAILIRNALNAHLGDGNVPVPEPSTYGVIGALLLVGIVARKRFSRS